MARPKTVKGGRKLTINLCSQTYRIAHAESERREVSVSHVIRDAIRNALRWRQEVKP